MGLDSRLDHPFLGTTEIPCLGELVGPNPDPSRLVRRDSRVEVEAAAAVVVVVEE